MKRITILFILLFAGPVFAQSNTEPSKWDIYLDHAYELTYWEEEELTSWIGDQEKEFGETLVEYVDKWHNTLFGEPYDESAAANSGRFMYPEDKYKRLAVAEFLLYLTTGDVYRLDSAVTAIEKLNGKLEKSDIAFWYYFIHSNEALADRGDGNEKSTDKFVRSIFKIWLNVVLPHEEENAILKVPSSPVSMKGFAYSMPYLYENITNMIIRKAIIKCELQNTGALGAVILALHERLSLSNGYADSIKTIVNRMTGPKSDSNNLFYTVIFLEAEQYRFEAQRLLNDSGVSKEAEEAFRKSEHYYKLASTSANTNQGKSAVLSDYLDLVSFAYSRLPKKSEMSSDSLFASLSGHEGTLTVEMAMKLFDELSDPDIRMTEWGKHGFAVREDYVSAMHNLWGSIVELSLWSAFYFEKEISDEDIRVYSENVVRTETALTLYLDFFERYLPGGYVDIIPDNAYFNAAEAAAKYSSLNSRLAPFSSDMGNYYKAFARLLQYVEIFPFNPDAIMQLAHQINEMGKPGLYVKYVLPIAEKIRELGITSSLSDENIPEPLISSLKELESSIPDIMLKANALVYLQGKGADIVREDIKAKMNKISEESKTYIATDSRLVPQGDVEIKAWLDTVIEQVSLGHEDNRDLDRKKFISDIEKLKRDIASLEESEKILADLEVFKETSRNIRQELAQKIDHPFHTVLRQFFYETAVDNSKYYQIFSMVK